MFRQDVKPAVADSCGRKAASTFLRSWLRQVTSSDKDHSLPTGAVPQSACRGMAGSSKRRKGRPRKYVAAAGDRTLTGDALLVDTASDSGLARFAVVPQAPSPPPPPRRAINHAADRPTAAVSQKPTTSGGKAPTAKRAKIGRRKDNVFQRGRRQPVKFIPAAEKRPPMKARRSRLSTVATTSMSDRKSEVRAVDGSVKRPRGRPRKHSVVPVFAPSPSVPAATKSAPDVAPRRHQLTDVENDSSDSDVIVTGYIAPRDVSTSLRQTTHRTAASVDGRKCSGTTAAANRGQSQKRNVVSELAVNSEVTQPVKRKRGRPRKYPLPTNATVATNSSSGQPRSVDTAAAQRPAAADDRHTSDDRRRVTRALTTAQMQHEWDTTRLATESSITPARNTPPLYYELSSSSDNEERASDFRSDVDRCPNNFRRKRKRHRSIPSRSLELSFSSIEKDDASGGEGACYSTSGRSCEQESHRAVEMTSTPCYDRSSSARDSTLRSRWINVEHRTTERTTAAVVHRNADRQSVSTTSATRTAAARQCQGSAGVHHRGRRRRRSSDNEDPDWRRYPMKPPRKQSRGDHGPASTSSGSATPVTTSHIGGSDPPAYDEAELDILVELQRRLAATSDGHVLRQVVEIIEASGRYHVEDATFDFDLCSLDRRTITELRRCLGV